MTKLAYHPAPGDPSLLGLFEPSTWQRYDDLWPFVHEFGYYRHAVTSDTSRDWLGPNFYSPLRQAGAFALPMPIRVEGGALKPWEQQPCSGLENLAQATRAYGRVPYDTLALDEPLTMAVPGANAGLTTCALSYAQAVEQTVRFLRGLPRLPAEGLVPLVELVEGYPNHNAATIASFLQDVQQATQRLGRFTVDVDPFSPHLRLTTDLAFLEQAAHNLGLDFGVIVTAHRVTDSGAYMAQARRWLDDIRHFLGHWPDWLVIQSWADRAPNVKDFPASIPHHLEFLRIVRDLVQPETRRLPMPRGPFISGNFLRSPANTRKHSCLRSAHPAPRNLGAYAKRGDTHLSLVVGFNSGDNPFNEHHWKFDIRRMPDRPRLLNLIELVQCKGMQVIGWVFLDDSPLGMSKRRVVVDQAARHLKGKVDIWIPALEANEYLTFDQHMELGKRLRRRVGPKDLILQHLTTDHWSHRNRREDWNAEHASWCDGIAIQCKTDVMTKMAEFRGNIHGERRNAKVYYGEGDADWDAATCDQMAQRLYDAGIVDGSLHGLIQP